MILAGIDIGTNATRLLIADTTATSHRILHAAREITRLGQDLDRTGLLSREAMDRTVRTLTDFAGQIAGHSVEGTAVVGTSALRRAANAAVFVREVSERTGLSLTVISGSEEARLTLQGVRRALAGGKQPGPDPLANALVADIGGGSTELIVTQGGGIVSDHSLELGAVYLTERHLRSDPPGEDEVEALRTVVRTALENWERELDRCPDCRIATLEAIAGTAGTITTLAALDQRMDRYDADRINGYRLTRQAVDVLADRLGAARLEERRNMPGLERGREDIIFAGAVIVQELLARTGRSSLLVSDWGLREGIVFDLFEKREAAAGRSVL